MRAVFGDGDLIGCLLDLDEGWLRFYLNGNRYGPGFTSGVKGPLLRAVHMGGGEGESVRIVPGAKAPANAGSAKDIWEGGEDDQQAGASEGEEGDESDDSE
jgi:hypothetical protein